MLLLQASQYMIIRQLQVNSTKHTRSLARMHACTRTHARTHTEFRKKPRKIKEGVNTRVYPGHNQFIRCDTGTMSRPSSSATQLWTGELTVSCHLHLTRALLQNTHASTLPCQEEIEETNPLLCLQQNNKKKQDSRVKAIT